MTDLYLHFSSGQEAKLALLAAGFSYDEEVGAIYHPTSSLLLLPEGSIVKNEEEEPVQFVPGYHVNIRTGSPELADNLSDYAVHPQTPKFTWA